MENAWPLLEELLLKHGICPLEKARLEKEQEIRSFSEMEAEKLFANDGERALQKWHEALFGTEINSRFYPEFEIKLSHPLVGLGLFTKRALPALTYIGRYAGIVRRREKEDRFNNYIFGYEIGGQITPYIIDASKSGNHTRFINHSDSPNLLSRSLFIEGSFQVFFYTLRAVRSGEELLCDYGTDYWKNRTPPLERS